MHARGRFGTHARPRRHARESVRVQTERQADRRVNTRECVCARGRYASTYIRGHARECAHARAHAHVHTCRDWQADA